MENSKKPAPAATSGLSADEILERYNRYGTWLKWLVLTSVVLLLMGIVLAISAPDSRDCSIDHKTKVANAEVALKDSLALLLCLQGKDSLMLSSFDGGNSFAVESFNGIPSAEILRSFRYGGVQVNSGTGSAPIDTTATAVPNSNSSNTASESTLADSTASR